jgi:EAL domain-containing protein (putative c-di-GMP-specific phosphodiesterase class I)
MKHNKLVSNVKLKNRVFFLRLLLILNFAVLCSGIGMMLYFLIEGLIKETITLTFIVHLVILAGVNFVLFGTLFIIYKYFVESDKNLKLYGKFFASGDFVFPTEVMEKFIRFRQKKQPRDALVIACTIKNFREETLVNRGQKFMAEFLSILANSLRNAFNSYKYCFVSFDYNETFLVYVETTNFSEISSVLKQMKFDIDDKIRVKNGIFSLDLLLGAYVINSENYNRDPARFVSYAEIASYRNGESNLMDEITYYDAQIDGDSTEISDIDAEIVRGLANNEFEVYYQPQFDLNKNKFNGAEALLRWYHPKRGLIYPGSFINIAEKSGRILDIDRYVFRHVCEDIAKWTKEGTRLMAISVNLSRRSTFDQGIITFIDDTIKQYHVNPLLIKVELTESIASKNVIYTEFVMKKIKDMDLKVALDDVGTGYSSLSVLKNLPVDVAKLDKSFFDDIEIDKKARDVIIALTALCHSLKMYVIAEGIQNTKQIAIVKTLGIDCVQGFYYSKALPRYAYEAFISKNKFESRGKTATEDLKLDNVEEK